MRHYTNKTEKYKCDAMYAKLKQMKVYRNIYIMVKSTR